MRSRHFATPVPTRELLRSSEEVWTYLEIPSECSLILSPLFWNEMRFRKNCVQLVSKKLLPHKIWWLTVIYVSRRFPKKNPEKNLAKNHLHPKSAWLHPSPTFLKAAGTLHFSGTTWCNNPRRRNWKDAPSCGRTVLRSVEDVWSFFVVRFFSRRLSGEDVGRKKCFLEKSEGEKTYGFEYSEIGTQSWRVKDALW